MRLSNKILGQGYVKERLKSSLRKFYGRYGDPIKQYEVPLSRMVHDILDDDHMYTVTPSIDNTLHQFLTVTDCALITVFDLLPNWRGFHRTFATGAACQQRTLTPADTWSCPTLGLICLLMSRPISPELVLFPDFWVSNIPRYFSFASDCLWYKWTEKPIPLVDRRRNCISSWKGCLISTWQTLQRDVELAEKAAESKRQSRSKQSHRRCNS